MVVPIIENNTRAVNLSETKKFVGNNLQLKFSLNMCTMVVIGNNCSIKVTENLGVVKVIGNNSAVDIVKCQGSVEYIGNNGSISIDSELNPNAVKYTGMHGKINTKTSPTRTTEKSKSENCLHAFTKKPNQIKNGSLENMNSLFRPYMVNKTVLINGDVKIYDSHIKTIDLNSFLYMGIVAK